MKTFIFNLVLLTVNKQLELPNQHSIYETEKSQYTLTDNKLKIYFKWISNDKDITVYKIFEFNQGSYVIDIYYEIINKTNKNIQYSSYVQLTKKAPVTNSGLTALPIFTGAVYFNNKDKFTKVDYDDFSNNGIDFQNIGGWIGFSQHYFLVSIVPIQTKKQNFSYKKLKGNYLTTVVNPINIVKKEIKTDSNSVFIGPKELKILNNVAKELDRTIDYGILYIISKPLAWLINNIFSFTNSWGWSIIILTIIIKILFYKLSEKSYRSMAKMKKLSPRIQQLKEIYGEDKKQMSQKTMEIFKKEKVNPASGCLPIVIQMPIFIALYWVLLESIELRHTPFWWLDDLSAKDPYFILPLIMGLSMFIQQKLNPPPTDPTQAKVMMVLPIVFYSIIFMVSIRISTILDCK